METKVKRVSLGLIGLFLIGVGTTTIDSGMLSQQFNKQVEVLNQWSGKWKSTGTISFGRAPRKINLTSTTTTNWIVNGYFQQSITIDEKNQESRRFDHYNKHSRTFHRYNLADDGEYSFWTGKWNKKTRTMTWTIQAGGFVKGTIVDTFENTNTIKSTINLTNGRGNVIFNLEEQRMRQ